jgi:hypothetical protein
MSTASTTAFNQMLNENVTNKLMELELQKRNFVYNEVDEDKNWLLNNNYVLPHIAGNASSVRFGGLTAAADITGSRPLRGYESVHKEMWGSLRFLQKDLLIHGKISEQNFLRILPDELERHMDYVAQALGQNICSGVAVDLVTVDGDASGNISIANPERFQIDQYVEFQDDDTTTSVVGYVKQININTGALLIVTAVGGVTGVNLSTITVAQNGKAYCRDQITDGFNSMIDLLLPASAGGSANIHNLLKLSSPQLQGVYADASAWTSADLLKQLFKLYAKARKVGAGKPKNILMSYNDYGACVNSIENQKGAFNVSVGSDKAKEYTWDEIAIGGYLSNGESVKLVAVQEMNDGNYVGMDPSTFRFASAGGLQKHKSPDGNYYFVDRDATNGYSYICDTFLMGNLFCIQPYKNFLATGASITY